METVVTPLLIPTLETAAGMRLVFTKVQGPMVVLAAVAVVSVQVRHQVVAVLLKRHSRHSQVTVTLVVLVGRLMVLALVAAVAAVLAVLAEMLHTVGIRPDFPALGVLTQSVEAALLTLQVADTEAHRTVLRTLATAAPMLVPVGLES